MENDLKRLTLLFKGNRGSLICKWCLLLLGTVILGLASQASPQIVRAAKAPELAMQSAGVTQAHSSPSGTTNVYLPFIKGGVWGGPSQPMIIGAYSPGWWGNQSDINSYLVGLDSWAGLNRSANKGHELAGDFKDLDDSTNISTIFDLLWTNGYVEFMNITANNYSSAQIASGAADSAIVNWANGYKSWVAKGGNRRAFLAPLEEMNINYGARWAMDPSNFKLAFARIVNIFTQQGVTRNQVWWVYAPNGWSSPPYGLGDYYPGNANVDIVAISSYNQSCRAAWMTPTQVFDPYINGDAQTIGIRQVAPTKPVFIAQTATASAGGNKDQWILDAYTYFLQQNIRGVVYFNLDKECDWAVYQPGTGGRQVQGYKTAVNSTYIRYYTPSTLAGLTFSP